MNTEKSSSDTVENFVFIVGAEENLSGKDTNDSEFDDEVEFALADSEENKIDREFMNTEREPDTDDMIVNLWIEPNLEQAIAAHMKFLQNEIVEKALIFLSIFIIFFIWAFHKRNEKGNSYNVNESRSSYESMVKYEL